jgi:hypothetical protein
MNNNDDLRESLRLPTLSKAERQRLTNGERLQKQTRDGRSGNGIVVVDVYASPGEVFDALTNFDRFAIPMNFTCILQ